MSLHDWAKNTNQSSTPGPGTYTISRNLGTDVPRYSISARIKERRPEHVPVLRNMRSSLSGGPMSFGCRSKDPPPNLTPAPSYTPPTFGKTGVFLSIQTRREEPIKDTPGPGNYNISRKLTNKKIMIGKGPRTDLINHETLPPPGAYDIPSDFENHHSITIGPFYKTILPEDNIVSPGPKYGIPPEKTSHKYLISEIIPIKYETDGPGPSAHSNQPPLGNPSSVGIKLKGRPPLPQPDKRDYPYHLIPSTLDRHPLSIGNRPEIDYHTLSPGPVFDPVSSLVPRPIYIGNRYSEHPPDDIPGPADYFKTEIPDREKLAPTLRGPISREPEEVKRDEWKVAPGSYATESEIAKNARMAKQGKKGYQFGGRKWNDFVPDTDPPYYPAESTLGGPKFTISEYCL